MKELLDLALRAHGASRTLAKKGLAEEFNTRVIRRYGPSIIKPPLTQTASLVDGRTANSGS
jgi:hypothetical protein